MASMYKRENTNGSISWRLVFRRAELPTFCTCFNSEQKAIEFSKKYEPLYCFDSDNFSIDRLKMLREREFERKGIWKK